MASTSSFTIAVGHVCHRVFHKVRASLIGVAILLCVKRRLEVVAGPDMVHPSFAIYQELVNIGSGSTDKPVGRPDIAFLMAAHANTAAAWLADVASCERDVH